MKELFVKEFDQPTRSVTMGRRPLAIPSVENETPSFAGTFAWKLVNGFDTSGIY